MARGSLRPLYLSEDEFEDLDDEMFLSQWHHPSFFPDIPCDPTNDHYPFSGGDIFSANPTPDSTPAVTPDNTPRGSFSATAPSFSSDGSSDEGGGEETAGSESEDESDEGETTDEEEDLPMPTPRGKSILRRVSTSSQEPESPQVVHIDRASRPRLGSWVADPNRPICVVEGSKKTFLIPKGKQLSTDETNSNGSVSNFMVMMAEESESENSPGFLDYNPTLGGLTGGDGLFLNGADILGPPEAFYPYFNEEGELIADGLEDEELDEYEANLKIEDFLELSSDEDDGNEHTDNDFSAGHLELALTDGACDEPDADDECTPSAELPAQMLSRWDKVSVTAFRKRQIQHAQKMADLHGNPNGSPTTGYGLKKKLGETITPTRRKKVKRRFVAGSRGIGANAAMKKKISNRKAEDPRRESGASGEAPRLVGGLASWSSRIAKSSSGWLRGY